MIYLLPWRSYNGAWHQRNELGKDEFDGKLGAVSISWAADDLVRSPTYSVYFSNALRHLSPFGVFSSHSLEGLKRAIDEWLDNMDDCYLIKPEEVERFKELVPLL